MSWELVYVIAGLCFLPILILSIVVSIQVNVAIEKYHHLSASSGMTAKNLVEQIAVENNLPIKVELATDSMGDHYDPRDKTVRLTGKVLNGTSVSALAIAAHECGHALQDAQNYAPLKLRNTVIKVSNFSSRLLTPLIIISLIASCFTFGMAGAVYLKWLMLGFCVIYGLSALVSLITLPTEFNASRRGKQLLQSMHIIETEQEQHAVDHVLRAAANTYVIAFAMSLIYFLRYLGYFMILFGRKDD